MRGSGGHKSRGGRRRADREEYRGAAEPGHETRGDAYWDAAGYDAQQGYDAQNGYGPEAGYYEQGGYDESSRYGGSAGYPGQPDHADRDGYGGRSGYGSGYGGRPDYGDQNGYGQHGYGDEHGYGDQNSYSRQGNYGGPPGYDGPPGYGGPAGYNGPPGYGTPAGYDDPAGYGDQAGYREQAGYGGDDGYGTGGRYGDRDRHGPGGYAGPGDYAQPGYGDRGGYDQAGYAGSGYGQAGFGDAAGYGADRNGRGRHSAAGLGGDQYGGSYGPDVDTSPYGPGGSGQAQPPGSADVYGPGGAGSAGRRAIESGYPADPAGTDWQRDAYGPGNASANGAYEPGGYRDTGYDTGSFGREDAGTDGGWAFTRPSRDALGPDDSASYGRPDTDAFGQPDTGSFGRPDAGSFGRPDHGALYRDDDYDARGQDAGHDIGDDPGQDTGSIRWTAGPPSVKGRADRGGDDVAAESGQQSMPANSAGYADWRDDPVDDDWDDDAAGGLLSRRFGGSAAPDSRGGGTRTRVRGRKRRRVRGKAAFTGAIVAVALLVGVAAAFGYKSVHTWITHRYGDYSGQGTGTVDITVTSGDNLVALGPTLLSKGVIKALRPYDTAAAAARGTLQPGVYRLHHHMNSALAVTYLLSPKYRMTSKVTIPEGLRAVDIAKLISDHTGIKDSQLLQLINHPPRALGLPSWAAGKTAEGFLFPDTYNFLPKESALQVLQTMVTEFKHKIAGISLVSQASTVNTTAWHVLIVASLAQAESAPSDFGKVARVAWNRLTQNMALHFDSTVFYGLGIPGNSRAAATSKEIQQNTPYNTYIHPGLPPGPIDNPGLAALKAALHPPHGPWLYFITDIKTGLTHFTASYSQFQQWQRQFQG